LVRQAKKLEWLNLRDLIHISDYAIELLAESLPKLTFLNLGCCIRLTNRSLFALARYSKNLEELDLWGCSKLTDIGIISLGNCSRSIKKVHIQSCPGITNQALSWMKTNRSDIIVKASAVTSHRIVVGDVANSSLFMSQVMANNAMAVLPGMLKSNPASESGSLRVAPPIAPAPPPIPTSPMPMRQLRTLSKPPTLPFRLNPTNRNPQQPQQPQQP